MVDTLIVDYRQQTFNDALYFLEEAKKIDPQKKPFDYWKNCILSIILSCVCMESYIISHIRSMTDEIDPQIWVIYQNNKRMGFYSKVKFIEFISDSKIIDEGDSEWKNITDAIEIRNDIIHFNQENIFSIITISNAGNAINACRDFVKKINNAIGLDNKQFSRWIDKKTSEDYNKPENS